MSLRYLSFAYVLVCAFALSIGAQETPDEKPETPAAEQPADAPQETPKETPAETPKETPAEKAPAAGPQAEAWTKALGEWKKLLIDLRTLREEYATAEKKDIERIRKEYGEKLTAGETMLTELKQKAREAFTEAPNEDRQLTRFLVKVAADDVKADNYEPAFELSKFLIDAKCDDKNIYNIAGIAAYGTNRFSDAKEYFAQAKAAGALSKDGEEAEASLDEVAKAWAEEEKFREQDAKSELPRVKLKTTKGDVVVELFANEAPDTVANFISLVNKPFYDGSVFHRVLPGFMAQGGDPNGDGTGGPGYNIYCECYKEPHRNHFAGTLSMAHAGKDTGGSQFYITFKPTPHLNGKHTVFGRVVEGLDVLSKLQRIDPSDPQSGALVPDKIVEATIEQLPAGKTAKDYKPNKVK